MKRKDKKSKIFLMLALILCITVGYAALTATLNITGNSEIKNAKWDIHFTNLVVDDTSVEATTPATIDANKTTVNYTVNLVKPGDSYSFAVDVENAGTIDGMISTVTNTGLTTEQQKYLEYSITYDNGNELKAKDGLKAGTKRNIKVKVKYKDDINPGDLPQEDKTLNLTFTVEYVQADDTVTPPPTPIMKSYTYSSIDDYHNSTYKSKITKIVTKNNIDVPATAKEQWDVSEAGDGSVVAYIEDDGTGNGTYQVTIGGDGGKVVANEDSSSLFQNFSSLKEIDVSNFDTSKVTNMRSMFSSPNLISLDLSTFNTSNVIDMTAMFNSCYSLTNIDLSSFDTSKVTSMQAMFNSCYSLTSIDLSSFDTSKVTDMDVMFYVCKKLKSLNLSSFDTSKVTTMNSMFASCSSLTSLDVSNFNTSNVTNMSNMFGSCISLSNLDLSNFDTRNVTSMGGMFFDCSNLTTVVTIKNSNVINHSGMFSGAATATGTQITVNYTSTTLSLVDQMIATKSSTSNVVKGSLVS